MYETQVAQVYRTIIDKEKNVDIIYNPIHLNIYEEQS